MIFSTNSCKKDDPGTPKLKLTEVKSIDGMSATSSGEITSEGESTILERGVCWSINNNPSVADSKTSDDIGIGTFSFTITGLIPATKYYVRAYAKNSEGFGYSNQITFVSDTISPLLTTFDVTNIAGTSASCGGNITTDGGAPVIARGVCWSTKRNPTINDNKTSDGTGIGNFTSVITGLSGNSGYFVRAFATNKKGTGYGPEVLFGTVPAILFNSGKTYGSITDIDGNVYKTITIGTQEWMAENLRVVRYRNGDSIPEIVDEDKWSGVNNSGAYCNYYNNLGFSLVYGKLYNWYVVDDSRNLAPAGWHVPTDADWQILLNYSNSEVGDKLKEKGKIHWLESENSVPTNESGFSAVPGGYRYRNMGFEDLGYQGIYWSKTDKGSSLADIIVFFHDNVNVESNFFEYKVNGYSVRCVKD